MTKRYADSPKTIQKTARRFQASGDAPYLLSMLCMFLTLGFADPQPRLALLTALAGLTLSVTPRLCAACSTTAAKSRTEPCPRRVASTGGTVSHEPLTERHTSRWNHTRNSTRGRI
nr:MAG TPA: hypothetical protein [Caudoviricetes sp.]